MQSYSWVPKALAQKSISKLGLLRLYHFAQRRGGRLTAFHPRARAEYAAKLAADVAPHRSVAGATLLEIGTGWVPVVPLLLHLMGARRIITIDLNPHLQAALTMRTVRQLADCFDDIHRRCGADVAAMHARLLRLQSAKTIDELFVLAGIEYQAPGNASATDLPAGSVDIVYSNLVLEHVTPAALEAIHAETARILALGGVAWHNVDYSDHYAATRAGLSLVNMLRYSDRFWATVGNNDILYQNRLRRCHHVDLFERAGLHQVDRVDHADSGITADILAGLPLQPRFRGLPIDELATTASRFVLRTAGSRAPQVGQTVAQS